MCDQPSKQSEKPRMSPVSEIPGSTYTRYRPPGQALLHPEARRAPGNEPGRRRDPVDLRERAQPIAVPRPDGKIRGHQRPAA